RLTAKSAPPEEGQVTTGPIYRSRKVYNTVTHTNTDGSTTDLRIPARAIELTTGEDFEVYDTSGIYTEDNPQLDLKTGLAKTRDEWEKPEAAPASDEHPELKVKTQLAWARAGIVTPEMTFIAHREGFEPEFVRREVASGRAVITANHKHPE
ncbi:phosphomethylpyrimidine synthase ThiC, partial [Psychrobacillus sp. MER TA 17]|nr:phosphomethylpyrimidine synthase ThiC [Psychrobacillus sp. MER TA 17]